MGTIRNYLMSLRLDGQYEELIEQVNEELERTPSDDLLWEMLADACLRTNRLDSAIRASLSCLKIMPTNQICSCYLIIAYLRQRDFLNCFNSVSAFIDGLDEAHKWFLFEEFSIALEAGVVIPEELPVSIRKLADLKIRKIKGIELLESNPLIYFKNSLKDGDIFGEVKAANYNPSIYNFDTLIDLIRNNEVTSFENILRMGWPTLNVDEKKQLEDEILKAKSADFELLAEMYRLFREEEKNEIMLSNVLRELKSFCFVYGNSYERNIQVNEKERKISFGVGYIESKTKILEELLPNVLGLISWKNRFNDFEERDLYSMNRQNLKSDIEFVVLTSSPTDMHGTALKYDSDIHLDCEFYSWNIYEIYTLQILKLEELLIMIGENQLYGRQSIIAFNFLSESMLKNNLDVKNEIWDRVKDAYNLATDWRKKNRY